MPPASVRPIPTWDASGPPRPVLLDTDLDGDDLVAFAVLLRDPGVDLRAVAVTGTGLVHCAPGVETARRMLAAFGRDDVPVACGREDPGPFGRAFPAAWRERADARLGLELPEAPGAAAGPADAATLIADTISRADGDLTIVAIGPWTNLQDAFTADTTLAGQVAGIHAMLGTIDAPGNVSIGGTGFSDHVEWNAGADPASVAYVLGLDIPVTLVPLDATDNVPVPDDMPVRLEPDHASAGADLAFELYLRNPVIAQEGQQLWDSLAAVLLSSPQHATWEDLAVTVSSSGATAGRLSRADSGRPVRAALAADAPRAIDALVAALRRGDPRPEPFRSAGEIRVRFDGTVCALAGPAPEAPGAYVVRLESSSGETAFAGIGGVQAPRTWADAEAFVADVDPENAQAPDWLTDLGSVTMSGEVGLGLTEIPAGVGGVVCGRGAWPDVTFTAGPGWEVAP